MLHIIVLLSGVTYLGLRTQIFTIVLPWLFYGPIRLLKQRLINHLSTYKLFINLQLQIQGCMAHGRSWLYIQVAMVIYLVIHLG